MRDRLPHFHRSAAGNVAAVAAIGFAVLASGAGMAIDYARLEAESSRLQDIADTAALAGASRGRLAATPNDEVLGAARDMAGAMAVRGLKPTTDVAVGSRAPTRVTVSLATSLPLTFGGLFDREQSMVRRSATAVAEQRKPICLLALDPSAPGTLKMQGSPRLTAPGCSVQINSDSRAAVMIDGSASIRSEETAVVGSPGVPARRVTPAPKYNQPAVADPIAPTITWPALAACGNIATVTGRGAASLQPGVYCGGLTFGSGTNVTLSPGLYVIQTGSLHLESNARVHGSGGVTFILLDPLGAVDMQGSADLDLRAQSSGPWQGIIIAVKPQPTRVASTLQGGNGMRLEGSIYAPTQLLRMLGSNDLGGSPGRRAFVVGAFEMQGSGELALAPDPRLAVLQD
ncbi:MAG TPA: pilus assembly protein TadG-related protein, partial [Allosphingosinicella sp.]